MATIKLSLSNAMYAIKGFASSPPYCGIGKFVQTKQRNQTSLSAIYVLPLLIELTF